MRVAKEKSDLVEPPSETETRQNHVLSVRWMCQHVQRTALHRRRKLYKAYRLEVPSTMYKHVAQRHFDSGDSLPQSYEVLGAKTDTAQALPSVAYQAQWAGTPLATRSARIVLTGVEERYMHVRTKEGSLIWLY